MVNEALLLRPVRYRLRVCGGSFRVYALAHGSKGGYYLSPVPCILCIELANAPVGYNNGVVVLPAAEVQPVRQSVRNVVPHAHRVGIERPAVFTAAYGDGNGFQLLFGCVLNKACRLLRRHAAHVHAYQLNARLEPLAGLHQLIHVRNGVRAAAVCYGHYYYYAYKRRRSQRDPFERAAAGLFPFALLMLHLIRRVPGIRLGCGAVRRGAMRRGAARRGGACCGAVLCAAPCGGTACCAAFRGAAGRGGALCRGGGARRCCAAFCRASRRRGLRCALGGGHFLFHI